MQTQRPHPRSNYLPHLANSPQASITVFIDNQICLLILPLLPIQSSIESEPIPAGEALIVTDVFKQLAANFESWCFLHDVQVYGLRYLMAGYLNKGHSTFPFGYISVIERGFHPPLFAS